MCFPSSVSVVPWTDHQCRGPPYRGSESPGNRGCPRATEHWRVKVLPWFGDLLREVSARLSHNASATLRASPEVYHWSRREKQRKAFLRIKDLLRSGRDLTHFDDRLPLMLACDASPYGLGAVLSHRMPTGEEKPVGFASRTLTPWVEGYHLP